MAATSARRAIPSILVILLLSMITGLVWWRVLHREPSVAKPSTTSTVATHCVTVTAKPAVWPAPATITISVRNASSRTGLAASVTGQLKQRGFKAVAPGNDATTSAVTEIRFASRYATGARLVQFYLPGSQLVTTNSTAATIVIAVGGAFKALATPAQVNAAKTRAPAVRAC